MKFVDEELEEWAKKDEVEDEIFEESRGFLSFLTRGLEAVKNEFNLVCLAHNIVRLYNLRKAKIYWYVLSLEDSP